MDFVKFMDSMKTCDQVSCGLLWTPLEVHGLSVDCCGLLQKSMDSPWTPSEIHRLSVDCHGLLEKSIDSPWSLPTYYLNIFIFIFN